MKDLNNEATGQEVSGAPAQSSESSALPPVTVPLSRPFVVGDATYTKLTVREPFVEDQMAVDVPGSTQGQYEVRMVARLCDVSVEALRKLPSCDYAKLQQALYGFLLPRAAAPAGPRLNLGISPDGADGK